MRNRYFFNLIIIASVIFAGCASQKYEFQKYPDKNVEGWVVSYGNAFYLGFTKDEFGSFPTDRAIAEERFNRRRNFLEAYYDLEHPGTTNARIARNVVLAPAGGVILIPYMFVENIRYHALGGQHQEKIPEEEQRKAEAETELRFRILREFIAQDMAYERSLINW